jgi:hypothetical protein
MNFRYIDKKEFHYPCGSDKILCYPVEVVLPASTYLFECYGASGGISENGRGGYGAYVSGYIKLNSAQRIFLFLGAQGHSTDWQQSFNGGGRCKSYGGGVTGGGSTDIRLVNSTGLDGLVSRIIVAGAGGGGGSISSINGGNGGNAGIFAGEDGKILIYSPTYSISSSIGASVSNGGNGGRCLTHSSGSCPSDHHAYNGGFGFGGDANKHGYGGGGGSGYFGGGGGAVTHGAAGSGAGGSSYVSGYSGFHSFKVENGQLKDTLSENHSSGLVFYNVYLQSGSETKYVGDGKVIITRITLINYSFRNLLKDYCYAFYALILVLRS